MKNPQSFVWYELMTPDAEAAGAFYQKVVGWDSKDSGMTDRTYRILSMGETMVGGIFGLTPAMLAQGAHPGWIGYVGVDDVDAAVASAAASRGSTMMKPADIPGVGRFAMVADPWGAPYVVFKGMGDAAPTPPKPGELGRIGWHELHAGDGPAAWEYYSTLYGWTQTDAMDMGPLGVYVIFGAGGSAIGGMMTRTKDMPVSMWMYYITVDTVSAGIARAIGAGAKLQMGPHEVPGPMYIAQLLDPQGAMFALLSDKR
jgi:predicted enzyme related to lactoylglutathione lyase